MRRLILLVALVLACSAVASANAIDPVIILNGPGDFQTVQNTTFTGAFTPSGTPTGNVCPAGVANCYDAQNQSGINWTSLSIMYTFSLATTNALVITCSSNLFDITNCGGNGVAVTVTPNIGAVGAVGSTIAAATGTVTLTFACSAAALPGCGIFNFNPIGDVTGVAGQNSFLNYFDPASDTSDILSTSFMASANTAPAPEPGTIALLFAGIGAISIRRRWRKG